MILLAKRCDGDCWVEYRRKVLFGELAGKDLGFAVTPCQLQNGCRLP